MLLAFRIGNFKSIKDEVVLSLEATAGKDLIEIIRRPAGHFPKSFRGVLPLAVIYGANGSGKSSMFLAADVMSDIVLYSGSDATKGEGPIRSLVPFRLSSQTLKQPTLMEVYFEHAKVRYLYGFKADHDRIVSEWLKAWPSGSEQIWFLRGESVSEHGKSGGWYFGDSLEGGGARGKLLSEQTREDALFITVASRFNHAQAMLIVDWFRYFFRTVDHTQQLSNSFTQEESFRRPEVAAWVDRFLNATDTGIKKVITEKRAELSPDMYKSVLDGIPEKERDAAEKRIKKALTFKTRTFHEDEEGSLIPFDLDRDESHGTQRIFALLGPLRDVLEHGYTLWVDELNAGLHHWLVRFLVKLFQDPRINPNNAQLILTSHDALLLDNTLIRRDQVYITEKCSTGGTDLISLAEFKNESALRIGAALYKQYLSGRFGGVPSIDVTQALNWQGNRVEPSPESDPTLSS